VLGRRAFLFLNQFGCVSPEIDLTFCYELARQRWMEGKIDLSSSGTGPSIDHRAYSSLTEFILLKRNVKKKAPSHIAFLWFGSSRMLSVDFFSNKGKPPKTMPFD